MAKRYRPVQRDQGFLLPPDMRDWLPEGHPVWLVIDAVGQMDTSAFHAPRRTGGAGTAGYDPDMLLTVLVWGYAHRVTSSRRMEELCRTDVAFRVICGGNLPDHCTLARFRGGFTDAAAGFFAQVLILCARLGMGRLGTVALDGMKIAANASKSANRTEETLRKMAADLVSEHAAADAAEDAMLGRDRRGDEPPPGGGWRPGNKDGRITAALDSIAADRAAAGAERDEKAGAQVEAARAEGPRAGRTMPEAGPEIARIALAREIAAHETRIADWHARNAARLAAGRGGLGGRPPVPAARYCRVRQAAARVEAAEARAAGARDKIARKDQARNGGKGPVRNLTDPDSRLMPVRGGSFIQGYNAQNVTSGDGLIIATELTSDTTDTAWFEPMLRQAEAAAALIIRHQPLPPGGSPAPPGIGLILGDAGYLSEHNLTTEGPDRLIATGKHRQLEKAARHGTPDPPGPASTAMASRLATEEGITACRQRGHIAETPHGNIKHNLGIRQLALRGKPRAAAEWKHAAAVHNLLKAITSGHLTHATLSALATQPAQPA